MSLASHLIANRAAVADCLRAAMECPGVTGRSGAGQQPAARVGVNQDHLPQRPAMGPALLIPYHRHQFWPGGHSLLDQRGINASRLLEAGQIVNT